MATPEAKPSNSLGDGGETALTTKARIVVPAAGGRALVMLLPGTPVGLVDGVVQKDGRGDDGDIARMTVPDDLGVQRRIAVRPEESLDDPDALPPPDFIETVADLQPVRSLRCIVVV